MLPTVELECVGHFSQLVTPSPKYPASQAQAVLPAVDVEGTGHNSQLIPFVKYPALHTQALALTLPTGESAFLHD